VSVSRDTETGIYLIQETKHPEADKAKTGRKSANHLTVGLSSIRITSSLTFA
jgi:hypothetical protein